MTSRGVLTAGRDRPISFFRPLREQLTEPVGKTPKPKKTRIRKKSRDYLASAGVYEGGKLHVISHDSLEASRARTAQRASLALHKLNKTDRAATGKKFHFQSGGDWGYADSRDEAQQMLNTGTVRVKSYVRRKAARKG